MGHSSIWVLHLAVSLYICDSLETGDVTVAGEQDQTPSWRKMLSPEEADRIQRLLDGPQWEPIIRFAERAKFWKWTLRFFRNTPMTESFIARFHEGIVGNYSNFLYEDIEDGYCLAVKDGERTLVMRITNDDFITALSLQSMRLTDCDIQDWSALPQTINFLNLRDNLFIELDFIALNVSDTVRILCDKNAILREIMVKKGGPTINITCDWRESNRVHLYTVDDFGERDEVPMTPPE